MSTAAEPRRPSPATMPARRPVAPVTTFRELYLFGIDSSSLHAHHQLVAYGLAIHADADGEIQLQDQPRLIGLVHDTGLHAGQVAVALTALRQRGWIRQTRRSDRYENADFRLTIPAQLEPRLRRRAAQQSHPATTERTTTDA
ncbi:hypothetical protein [Streptomyces sp. NPDC048445]|uniref:hypothetical protein n=1 Tax=Streptomyces sp. NPDC048445 TaxID=3365553 RepID=UPI003721D3EC